MQEVEVLLPVTWEEIQSQLQEDEEWNRRIDQQEQSKQNDSENREDA